MRFASPPIADIKIRTLGLSVYKVCAAENFSGRASACVGFHKLRELLY
jgi:hypothetical protein